MAPHARHHRGLRRELREATVSEPNYTVYGGRLLNLCMERAMLIGLTQSSRTSEKWPTLKDLARSTYVRQRLDKGCA